jgi:hypothetical protein
MRKRRQLQNTSTNHCAAQPSLPVGCSPFPDRRTDHPRDDTDRDCNCRLRFNVDRCHWKIVHLRNRPTARITMPTADARIGHFSDGPTYPRSLSTAAPEALTVLPLTVASRLLSSSGCSFVSVIGCGLCQKGNRAKVLRTASAEAHRLRPAGDVRRRVLAQMMSPEGLQTMPQPECRRFQGTARDAADSRWECRRSEP